MNKNLVIVESPAKAKTIEKYLGKDFVVKSSMGHVRSLPSKTGSVDVSNNYAPIYEINEDKTKIINELKKASKTAKTVWLASDEDREGEAIAWHLTEVLGLNPKTTKRIVFHEITQTALEEAIANPRIIDLPLVEAQQARQSLDYLVGFELSPVLWKKVRPQLSAGRVQSVAVRLVVEREKEIGLHNQESSYKLVATFKTNESEEIYAEAPAKYTDLAKLKNILEDYNKSSFTVEAIVQKPGNRNPGTPFTTSTLQQEASNKIGFSPRTTMQLAQRLYEAGHITYIRTDSLNLSKTALDAIASYIKKEYGNEYYNFRTFKAKSAGAQEAHEAIRPTNFTNLDAGADAQQKKLYNLIWHRTVASQMSPAKVEKTTITIRPSNSKEILEVKGEIVTFDGFLKVTGRKGDDTILPPLKKGDSLKLSSVTATESLSRGAARFTEASLVKKLEEMGIGRPSTYASTISTIQSRGYVERGDISGVEKEINILTLLNNEITHKKQSIEYGKDTNKLFPTDTGKVVTDFLVKHFADVMDYDFTKDIEDQLDHIAEKKKNRIEVLNHFYKPFHKLIEASVEISRAEATQTRKIGKDTDGTPIFARYGRFGPMLQRGEQSDDPKPTFAPLPKGESIDSVTLKQALKMFKLPRIIGKTKDDQEIIADIGRFGPYIKVDKTYVSLKEPFDPFTIKETDALKLYKAKLTEIKKRNVADFGKLKVLIGPFGPYVTDGKKNAKIPKETDPKKLTEKQAQKLLDEAPAKKRRYNRKIKK